MKCTSVPATAASAAPLFVRPHRRPAPEPLDLGAACRRLMTTATAEQRAALEEIARIVRRAERQGGQR